MPSGSFKQVDIQCPFFRYDDGRRRIICEGVIEETSLSMLFLRQEDYDIQLRVFCCEHYKKCELYRMLMENKYEDS